MKKATAMIIMLVFVSILFGGIYLLKLHQDRMIKKIKQKNIDAAVTVSAMKAVTSQWKSEIHVIGSSRTVKGVNVTPELAGMVKTIYFKPGEEVIKGTLLVQLNIDPDIAELHKLQADAKIAKITYRRDLRQYKIGGVSKEQVDQDRALYESTNAQVRQQQGIIAKKTVRAPFSGRLGISLVYPGQYLNPGDSITSLETIKPIYIDFYVPQQNVPNLHLSQTVQVEVDAYPKEIFTGLITTINPVVDQSVRNILAEATLANDEKKILPGMFVQVTVDYGQLKTYVTLPQMAITFNSHGSIVYLLTATGKTVAGKKEWKVSQHFITTGDTRGDQIAVLSGIKPGDYVVTGGQLKIKEGILVVINNTIQPPNNPNPDFLKQ